MTGLPVSRVTVTSWNIFPAKFSKMEESEEMVVEDATNLAQEDERTAKLTQLPITRVRNMMKLDPDLHLANKEAVFLLTKATVSLF